MSFWGAIEVRQLGNSYHGGAKERGFELSVVIFLQAGISYGSGLRV